MRIIRWITGGIEMDLENLALDAGLYNQRGPTERALARFADAVLEEAAKVARAQRLGMPGHAGPGPCPILYKGSVEDAIRALKTP
jgi:hypothetical protein